MGGKRFLLGAFALGLSFTSIVASEPEAKGEPIDPAKIRQCKMRLRDDVIGALEVLQEKAARELLDTINADVEPAEPDEKFTYRDIDLMGSARPVPERLRKAAKVFREDRLFALLDKQDSRVPILKRSDGIATFKSLDALLPKAKATDVDKKSTVMNVIGHICGEPEGKINLPKLSSIPNPFRK